MSVASGPTDCGVREDFARRWTRSSAQSINRTGHRSRSESFPEQSSSRPECGVAAPTDARGGRVDQDEASLTLRVGECDRPPRARVRDPLILRNAGVWAATPTTELQRPFGGGGERWLVRAGAKSAKERAWRTGTLGAARRSESLRFLEDVLELPDLLELRRESGERGRENRASGFGAGDSAAIRRFPRHVPIRWCRSRGSEC